MRIEVFIDNHVPTSVSVLGFHDRTIDATLVVQEYCTLIGLGEFFSGELFSHVSRVLELEIDFNIHRIRSLNIRASPFSWKSTM